MYFKRLLIRDFGPIRDIEFNFEKDKVYHFIGDNDSGKSMILDAMNILCHNIPDIHVQKYVSDYANSFYIEGEDFEGNIIGLKRGDETWYYLKNADGKEKYWDKIRGNVPHEVQRIVNMYEDDVKKEKFNFRYADDKILFMNTTAGENYSYFQKALGTDKVIQSLKKANTESNGLDKELGLIESKLEYEKEKLDENVDLSNVKENILLYKNSVDGIFKSLKIIKEILDMYECIDLLDKVNVPSEIKGFDFVEFKEHLDVLKKIEEVLYLLDREFELDEVLKDQLDILDIHEEVGVTFTRYKEIEGYFDIRDEFNIINKKVTRLESNKSDYELVRNTKEVLIDNSNKLEVLMKISDKEKVLNNMGELLLKLEDVSKYREESNILIGTRGSINNLVDFLGNLKSIL